MEIRLGFERPAMGAGAWFGRTRRDGSSYRALVENAAACECGGTDGVAVLVSDCRETAPSAHNLVMVVAFSHHAQGAEGAFLTIEEAKQLVNRLGEAIGVAERVQREATT